MKILDEKGLQAALEELEKPDAGSTNKRRMMSHRRHRFWLVASIVVASASCLIHLASIVAETGCPGPVMMVPAVLAIVLCGRMLAASGYGRRSRKQWMRWDFLSSMQSSREEMAAVRKMVPASVRTGLGLLVVYVVINFLVFLQLAREGNPVETENGYWLQDHGRRVRAITKSEFRHRETWELRGMSGHFVLLAALSVVGFAYVVEHRPKDAS